MSLLLFPRAAQTAAELHETRSALPRAPQTPEETGLSGTFLVELVAKVMYQLGLTRLTELSAHLCLTGSVVEALCQFMRRETLLEVTRRGQHEADVQFELTQAGRARAAEWLARNSYTGAAPVTLESYTERVRAQSVVRQAITAAQMQAAFADLIVPAGLVEQLGTAINSARPMLLYGPAGSGKTYLAEQMQRLLVGAVAIPHAIAVHGEVIRVFDAQCHRLVAEEGAPRTALDNRGRPDARWLLCERPCVVSGGELTLEMLDLSFDGRAGYYEAPPHFKANNGIFIVDDLGRQVITPRQLMNRWVVPMERRHDHLMLRNGGKFTIPFDLVLVFSSNLRPDQLEDPAFLRRIGHKIAVGELARADYEEIFRRACANEGIAFAPELFARLLDDYHRGRGRPLLACYPRDLLHLIASRSRYLGAEPALSPELIEWAWQAYFGNEALIEAATESRNRP
ncbi:ATP-binding protein [uncultured Piscinibacter sp.]|uniref:ATP-binding protein n=1 Tax=uncultured Piscinibacter sp. TaxID=1131835 RepID=UPI002632A577|nr:ATP-binding protein [uncultured Piscinibacter sp.]